MVSLSLYLFLRRSGSAGDAGVWGRLGFTGHPDSGDVGIGDGLFDRNLDSFPLDVGGAGSRVGRGASRYRGVVGIYDMRQSHLLGVLGLSWKVGGVTLGYFHHLCKKYQVTSRNEI